MPTNPLTSTDRRAIVDEWRASGLSQNDFCDHVRLQRGIPLAPRTLRTWIRAYDSQVQDEESILAHPPQAVARNPHLRLRWLASEILRVLDELDRTEADAATRKDPSPNGGGAATSADPAAAGTHLGAAPADADPAAAVTQLGSGPADSAASATDVPPADNLQEDTKTDTAAPAAVPEASGCRPPAGSAANTTDAPPTDNLQEDTKTDTAAPAAVPEASGCTPPAGSADSATGAPPTDNLQEETKTDTAASAAAPEANDHTQPRPPPTDWRTANL